MIAPGLRRLAIVGSLVGCGGAPPPAPQPVRAEPAPPPAPDPEVARQQAIEEARTAVLLGQLAPGADDPAGLSGADVPGGLIGTDADGTYGGFGYGGLGLRAVGSTGGYRTIGHGSGTQGGPPTEPPTGPQVRIGEPQAQGGLDKAIIRRYLRLKLGTLRSCYEQGLVTTPTLAGAFVARFTIDPAGKVSTSTATGASAEVADCVAAAITAIEFPRPTGGGSVVVTYPITFTPAAE